jgi:hypothetical protein
MIDRFVCILDESEEQGKERNKCVLLWQVITTTKKKRKIKYLISFFFFSF